MHDVFIICPKADNERRAMLTERFEAVGCRVNFVDAVMGDTLSDADKRPFFESNRQFYVPVPFRDTEIGCTMSHHKAWQMIAAGDADVGFVFEDDAMPVPETAKHVESVLEKIARGVGDGGTLDLVKLYQRRRPDRKTIHIHALTSRFNLSMRRFQGAGGLAYMISKSAAHRLLSNRFRYCLTWDALTHKWWHHDCEVLILDSPLFCEDGRDSLIEYSYLPQWESDGWHHKIVRKWWKLYYTIVKRVRFRGYVRRARGRFD